MTSAADLPDDIDALKTWEILETQGAAVRLSQ